MSSSGHFSLSDVVDTLPIPATSKPMDDEGNARSLEEEPTASHALAMSEPEENGAAQEDSEEHEIVDLGWNESADRVPNPVVGGVLNEDLWLLVRRFDAQTYHLKGVKTPPRGGLDLNIADEEEFSPDKLRSNVERLYTTVIVGLIGAVNHIARLRSWRESRRTTAFCTAYFIAWALDFLIPLLFVILITLITIPKARTVMFPPAPIALVDKSTGGVQQLKAGVLGSKDSITGAPENHKGEAVEQEASNFVTGIASIALTSATGKHPQGEVASEDDPTQDTVPDPTAVTVGVASAKSSAHGKMVKKHDKTKQPMESAMWEKMRPIMHVIGDICDTWERFGNALSPTPPFPRDINRLRLAMMIVPAVLGSLFITSYMVVKGLTFGIGFGFFGDPVITPGLNWLNSTFPHWQKILELRNTVLKGVPTNAQLTITLLRLGEANDAPLPPPPEVYAPPRHKHAELKAADLEGAAGDVPLNATQEELDAAIKHTPSCESSPQTEPQASDIRNSKAHDHGKKGGWLLGLFKGTTKASVNTAIGVNKAQAASGSTAAKNRLGVIPPPGFTPTSGPVEFKARYRGRKGNVWLSTKATVPCVAFSSSGAGGRKGGRRAFEEAQVKAEWSVPIADIKELRKIGGYGWKAKLVVGWALERKVTDGLEIVDHEGNPYIVTAVPLRNELFNRLCSMGGQKWESW